MNNHIVTLTVHMDAIREAFTELNLGREIVESNTERRRLRRKFGIAYDLYFADLWTIA